MPGWDRIAGMTTTLTTTHQSYHPCMDCGAPINDLLPWVKCFRCMTPDLHVNGPVERMKVWLERAARAERGPGKVVGA